jgi:hypothetical protein
VAVHAFVIIVLSPLASVFKVGGKGAFCHGFLHHQFPRLVEVDLGVNGRHLYCAEVVEVVEYCVVVDVVVGVLSFDPTH